MKTEKTMRKKKIVRIGLGCLVAVLLLGGVSTKYLAEKSGELRISEAEAEKEDVSVVVKKPIGAKESIPSEKTEDLSTPLPTEEPVGESESVPAKEPKETGTPLPTEEPVGESEPVPAKEPKETGTPLPTEEPAGESEPVPTKEPKETGTPLPTEEPIAEIAPHVHSYVTKSESATCEENGRIYEECSGCGDICNETMSSAKGHGYEIVYVMNNGPTCTASAYYNLICVDCGHYGGDGREPGYGHTPAEVSRTEANCSYSGTIRYECATCNADLGCETYLNPDNHHFKEYKNTYWSEEKLTVVTETVILCEWCQKAKE